MSRSSMKALGLFLLIPSALIGILPIIAARTSMLSGYGDTTWDLGATRLLEITQAAGTTSAVVHPIFWVLAGIGELLLIGVAMFRPERTSRWIVTHR
jgi:hypothetical protein